MTEVPAGKDTNEIGSDSCVCRRIQIINCFILNVQSANEKKKIALLMIQTRVCAMQAPFRVASSMERVNLRFRMASAEGYTTKTRAINN